ncbi:HNH endonuclease signature motif containing protein [uncultured Dietzia sp.]|uniref:HNH endonuclease signature motif containing protein n=1 Tax=uncultured Dietzia sp. TaxID=395519 RepID=UPI0025FAC954|nr:HNH endonuclease signature motif containing protein [uncultured Dietzia sp.]
MAMAGIDQTSEPGTDTRIPEASKAVLEALQAENRAAAARLRACYALLDICDNVEFQRAVDAGYDPMCEEPQDYALIDPFDIACAEIVAAYGVHTHRARALIKLSITLVNNFPALLEAMECGRLDEATVKMLARQMRVVESRFRSDVQKAVVDWLLGAIDAGQRPGRDRILSQTDRIIEESDPDGVLARRRRAITERNVQVRRSSDGMTQLHAYLTSAEAAALYEALQMSARDQIKKEKDSRGESTRYVDAGVCDNSPGRRIGERRADALVDAILGPGHGADPGSAPESESVARERLAGETPRAQLRPHITVLTELGPGGEPAVYMPRGGPATIDALMELLSRCVGAAISVPDPTPGSADSSTAARRYRISAELARRIRLRDGTCRHPGCSVPADDCDVDHIRPFNHSDTGSGGLTVEFNLMCLCRRHHRFKTFHGWEYQLARDGTLTVTTSTGHTLTTEPDGPLARWRQRPDEGASPDAGPPRPWLSPEPKPTYWFQRMQRQVAARRENIAARRVPEPGDPGYDPPPF